MDSITKVVVVLLAVLVNNILCADILYVAPVASTSHHIWHMALTMGLLERGHTVTMLSHEIEKSPLPKNFTLITMEGFFDLMYETTDLEDFIDGSILSSIISVYDFAIFNCEYDYNTSGFQTLLNYPEDHKFDLIIFDSSIGTRCYYPLIERFRNPPAVVATPFLLPPILSTIFGNHLHTSYIPFYDTQFSNKMSLMERTLNFIYTYADVLYRNYVSVPMEDAIIKEKFENYKYTPAELERSISLLLCNADPILDYPVALPPNIIPVGGLHARPVRSLPKDLQKIMDEAEDGVILFSFGTNVRSDQLDFSTKLAFLEAFARFPHIVLWKCEENEFVGLPKNVIMRKWIPQNDLLGHPNTKLLVCHGGALSTQEAMYHGVPVVGIPFFDDQYVNIRKMEERKIAKYLDRNKLGEDNVFQTIKEVLNDDFYKENMLILSKKYHDQPQTALERGIFWIEYLLRHGSVEHLVLPMRDMPTYQTVNLDVIAFFGICIASIYFIIFHIINL